MGPSPWQRQVDKIKALEDENHRLRMEVAALRKIVGKIVPRHYTGVRYVSGVGWVDFSAMRR